MDGVFLFATAVKFDIPMMLNNKRKEHGTRI